MGRCMGMYASSSAPALPATASLSTASPARSPITPLTSPETLRQQQQSENDVREALGAVASLLEAAHGRRDVEARRPRRPSQESAPPPPIVTPEDMDA